MVTKRDRAHRYAAGRDSLELESPNVVGEHPAPRGFDGCADDALSSGGADDDAANRAGSPLGFDGVPATGSGVQYHDERSSNNLADNEWAHRSTF